MKLRAFSLLLTAALIIGMLSCAVCAAPDPYWAAQKEYNTALEKGDDLGIAAAAKKIQDRYASEHNETAYSRMTTPTYQAAIAYERQGMFREAGEEYAKLIDYSKWLAANASSETTRAANAENIKAYERHIRYFNIGPEVYTLTSNKDSIPYYGELNEPKAGTYVGLCGTYTEGLQSGYLLYVRYAEDGFSDYEHYLPKTENIYYLTAAWNSKNENEQDLRDVVNGKTDDYMIRELKYLEGYAKDHSNVRILLRIFAEQNVWKPLNSCGSDRAKIKEYAELYISAYRHIAEAARKHAPSVALVFSPVDYGQWYTTPEDFYPGDEYVDWVGMSTYYNKNSQEAGKVGDKGDKNLARGLYNLPIVRTAEIMELAESHSKPVLIAECGFAYRSDDGLQSEAYAKEKMRNFYSYINVVYPQVKLVNYFNANSTNYYRLYEDTPYSFDTNTNKAMRKLYEELVMSNGAMSSVLDSGSGSSYTKLGSFKESRSTLNIVSYFDYATATDETVTYYLNGAKLKSVNKLPFELELGADKLNTGDNILEAVFEAEKTKITKKYNLTKEAGGVIVCSEVFDEPEETTVEETTVTEVKTEAEATSEIRTEDETSAETETESETVIEAESESETETEAESESTSAEDTESDTETATETESESETETAYETVIEIDSTTTDYVTEDVTEEVHERDESTDPDNKPGVAVYAVIGLIALVVIGFVIKKFR